MDNLSNISNLKKIDIEKFVKSSNEFISNFNNVLSKNNIYYKYDSINHKLVNAINLLNEYYNDYNTYKEKNIDELIYKKNIITNKLIDILEVHYDFLYSHTYLLGILYYLKNNITILISSLDKNIEIFTKLVLLTNIKYKRFNIIFNDYFHDDFKNNYIVPETEYLNKDIFNINNYLYIIILLIIYNFNIYIPNENNSFFEYNYLIENNNNYYLELIDIKKINNNKDIDFPINLYESIKLNIK